MITSSRSIVDGYDNSDSASLTEQDPWGGVGVGIGSKASLHSLSRSVSPSLDSLVGARFTWWGIPLDGIWSIVLSLSMLGW